MAESFKIPPRVLAATLAVSLVIAVLVLNTVRLNANLRSTTKITQGLRDELETLRKENQTYQSSAVTEKTRLENMNTELNNLKEDKSVSTQRQEELKKLVDDAERSLQNQNGKIKELEQKLKEADEKMRRQKKASASLEQQTRSAKANPTMTSEYFKIVENEWLAATTKTEQVKKDLDKTLAELADQNKEREKLRSDTATMHYNLAVILTDQQNYPAAIREYEKVLEIRPNDADAHYNLAIIYDSCLKDNQKALDHYRMYIQIAPRSSESPRVRQWIKDKEFDTTFKFKV